MRPRTSSVRCAVIPVAIGIVALTLAGCRGGNKLDGVYHLGNGGSSIVITIKGKKATVNQGGQVKTLDYKVEGKKLSILDPKEGNLDFTINEDGTLTSGMGTFSKASS